MGQSVERRRNTRRSARMPVDMNLPNLSSVIVGKTQDISLGGMKVKTENTPSFKLKDDIVFSVNREYLKFQGQGKILWLSRREDTLGIKFTQLDKKSKKSLEEFLSLFADVPTSNN